MKKFKYKEYSGTNKDAFEEVSKLTYKEREGLLSLFDFKPHYLNSQTKSMIRKYYLYKMSRFTGTRARKARKQILSNE